MSTYVSKMPLVLGVVGQPEFHVGAIVPSAVGVAAPIGSGYMSTADGAWYRKTGAGNTDWTAVGAGGSSAPINELWGPRVTPHTADDEFDQNALAGAWSQTGMGGALNFGTRPQPYTSPGGGANLASWENLRGPDVTTDPSQNSWLRIQPGSGPAGVWKSIGSAAFGGSVPTDLLVWARFRFSWVNETAPGGAGNDIGMSLFQESGGGFSFATHATINLCNTQEGVVGGVNKPLFWGRNGSTVTNISEGTRQNAVTTERSDYSFYSGYVGLQKTGNDYWAWLLDDGGRLSMGVYSTSGLTGINAIALWCRGNSSAYGMPLFDIDFVRFYQGTPHWIP